MFKKTRFQIESLSNLDLNSSFFAVYIISTIGKENILSISEKLVAVESSQTTLMRELEKNRFDCMPVQLRHCRTLSGGPHCVTLDTVRQDCFEDFS
jgi:hypothetical protein